jgi:hypothetical protein
MIAWTIQPYPVWERLQSDGILYGPNIEETFAEKSIQGTFWQLSLSQVRQVKVFRARTRGPGW